MKLSLHSRVSVGCFQSPFFMVLVRHVTMHRLRSNGAMLGWAASKLFWNKKETQGVSPLPLTGVWISQQPPTAFDLIRGRFPGRTLVSGFIIHCPKRVYCKSRESIPEIIFCTLAQQCVSICKHASVLTSHTKRDTCKPQPLVVSIISAGVSCDKFLTHPASAEGFLEEVVESISGHTGISWPSWGSSAWKLWLAGCWKNVWVWSGSSLSCSTSLTYKYNGVPDNMLFKRDKKQCRCDLVCSRRVFFVFGFVFGWVWTCWHVLGVPERIGLMVKKW